jgi:hypothetical protein
MRLDDDLLANSIVAAFDRLPEPEAARLEGLEYRLLHQAPRSAKRPSRARFWWLFMALIATGAAAWWGGRYWTETRSNAKPPGFTPTATETIERAPEPAEAEKDADVPDKVSPDSETGSQTIYRREVY